MEIRKINRFLITSSQILIFYNLMYTTTNVFTYGSLMNPEVFRTIATNKYPTLKAILRNHQRKQVKNAWYPGIK